MDLSVQLWDGGAGMCPGGDGTLRAPALAKPSGYGKQHESNLLCTLGHDMMIIITNGEYLWLLL